MKSKLNGFKIVVVLKVLKVLKDEVHKPVLKSLKLH